MCRDETSAAIARSSWLRPRCRRQCLSSAGRVRCGGRRRAWPDRRSGGPGVHLPRQFVAASLARVRRWSDARAHRYRSLRSVPPQARPLPRRRSGRSGVPHRGGGARCAVRARLAGQRRDVPKAAPALGRARDVPHHRHGGCRVEPMGRHDRTVDRQSHELRPPHHRRSRTRQRRRRRARQRRDDRPPRRGRRSATASARPDRHRTHEGRLAVPIVHRLAPCPGLRCRPRLARRQAEAAP